MRETVSLDGTWDFHFCGSEDVPLAAVSFEATIAVPGPWQAAFPELAHRGGHAWYRRTFALPKSWKRAATILRFGAVHYHARVFVNGMPIAEHEGGWLPFEVDITPALRQDRDNELAVLVTAPTDDADAFPAYPFGEIPFGKQSWYGLLGGIWQSVSIERRSPLHLTHPRVIADGAAGTVRFLTGLSQDAPGRCELTVEITHRHGGIAAGATMTLPSGGRSGEVALRVPDPELWSPEDPALYRLTATLRHGGKPVDAQSKTFGFRTIEARDGRLLLNGNPVFLRGALDQDYYPEGICTPPSLAFIEDQFRKAKAMGLNCVRCHIKVPDPRYYEAADRIGIMVWSELPNTGRLTDQSAFRAERMLHGIVERDGHHPSIVCWTIINENWGTDLVHDPEHRAWLKRVFRWLKAFDPTRLVVDNSPLAPSFHVESDLADFHFYAGLPDHRRSWDAFIDDLAQRPAWLFSPHGDAVTTGREPILVSEFGNWGLPNPCDLADGEGKEPWWFETGHDWCEGVMYPHGVEHRFHACGLAGVFGSWTAFVDAVQWHQFRALKYQIESMRSRPEFAGYVVTELTDCHWESNGLMDMRRNLRAFHGALAAINGDTAVLPRWERVAYWSGEGVSFDLHASHFGRVPVRQASVRWSLDAMGAGDACALPELEPGTVVGCGAQSFVAPEVPEPQIHRVELELATAERIHAASHLDLAIYPRRDPAAFAARTVWSDSATLRAYFSALGYVVSDAPDALVVAHALDAGLCGRIRVGARVLLLIERTMALEPVFPHWQAVRALDRAGSAWQGDWASSFSWLRRSGPFSRIPGSPLLDHAFDRVIPRQVITGCSGADFHARVHAGIVVGWVHKPAALIVEREYGKGRLVATTFRLTADVPGADPTATSLLDALVTLTAATRHAAPAIPPRRGASSMPVSELGD